MNSNKKNDVMSNCTPQKAKDKDVSVINTKKRSYEDLKENRDMKSVLFFVPRIVQINDSKKGQRKETSDGTTNV